jgi:thioredoxin reductase
MSRVILPKNSSFYEERTHIKRRSFIMDATLPVAVIGGGPVGLAAAAHLLGRGIAVRIYEAGESVAANVRDWAHVRLFSPWRYNIDSAARALLKASGWREPELDSLPTGGDLVRLYLAPLAGLPRMAAVIETGARVTAIAREGFDKVKTDGRERAPFSLVITDRSGATRRMRARAVIDASGTWSTPNPLGANGVPAPGERENADRIATGIPDVLGAAQQAYANKRLLVVGGGHSAANVLLDLAHLAEMAPQTAITWVVRSASLASVLGGGDNDQLPARGQLGRDLRRLVESGRVVVHAGASVSSLERGGEGIIVALNTAAGPASIGPFDRIVAATGQRPDLSLTRELRLDLDPWLESTRALGPMIDPNVHSCGTVRPHGYQELQHLEPNFYTAGIKSYGRAPTFLLATGYEQVRSIAAHLAGDEVAATRVELCLPETGVCGGVPVAAEATVASCCTVETPQGACCPPKPELPARAACCGTAA